MVALFGGIKFSVFQIRSVFLQNSVGNEHGIEKAYIPLRDFKDRFYPGRKWKADFGELEIRSRVQAVKDDGGQSDDGQSEAASMLID